MESFTTRDVARLLGLSPTQVRSQARAGFLSPDRGPRNDYRFSFQDLILLRTARELARARVPSVRIRSALRDLARQLPVGRSLTEIRITAEGHRVLVRDGPDAWNPESGQLQIDFALVEPPRSRKPPMAYLTRPHTTPEQPATAGEWFDRALSLETFAPNEANHAYTSALSIDPFFWDAHVNLGRLLQLAGHTPEAIEHYRQALSGGTADPTAAFNLGTALEEQREWTQAVAAYERAIRIDPRFGDAHFNLARLYEQLGQRAEALRHFRTYRLLNQT
jgi:DNA-binding transcriptional MerR regulator